MTSKAGIEAFPADRRFLLGHQGGWDEILLVAGPLLIVGLLLWLANKRVTAQLEQTNEAEGRATTPPDRPSR